MLELLRTFLGYCHSCRRPALVGEFRISGWRHSFNLCDACLNKSHEQLLQAEDDIARKELADAPNKDKTIEAVGASVQG